MLIALVGVLLFAAVWFTVLRPKDAETVAEPVPAAADATAAADPAASGGTSVTEAPAQAQAAADAASADVAEREAQAAATSDPAAATTDPAAGTEAPASSGAAGTDQAAAGESATAATGAAATETTVTTDPDAPAGERAVLRQLADGKVVVMLFWDKAGADDRAARRAVAEATKNRKNVAVRIVSADKVASYEAITGGVTIAQTPTTLVIGPEQKAVTISGLIDPLEVKQAIARMTPDKG